MLFFVFIIIFWLFVFIFCVRARRARRGRMSWLGLRRGEGAGRPLTAHGAKMLTGIAAGGGCSPVKSTTSGSPGLPRARRVPASTRATADSERRSAADKTSGVTQPGRVTDRHRNRGLFLSRSSTGDESGSVCVPRDVTSTMRPGIVPSRIQPGGGVNWPSANGCTMPVLLPKKRAAP